MINLLNLSSSLLSAGLPIWGVANEIMQRGTSSPSTWYPLGDGTWIRVDWNDPPSESQDQLTSSIVSSSLVLDAKSTAYKSIDQKTLQLLSQGFSYTPSGQSTSHNFGLDATSVANWTGMMVASSFLTYPFQISSLDGSLVNLTNVQDVQGFYSAGVTRSSQIQQGGIQLKSQINACTTVDQVTAIQDTRE